MDSQTEALPGALLRFNGDAFPYCEGISDAPTRGYAMDYTRLLQSRAAGVVSPLPRVPARFFQPNCRLIQRTLEEMYARHFPRNKRSSPSA